VRLRILIDRMANAVVDRERLTGEIGRVLNTETEFHDIEDRFADFQVGGAVNPRAILGLYDGRKEDDLMRLVLTGYDLRSPEQSYNLDASREGTATVVSTHRLQGSQLLMAVASTHGLLHQRGRVSPSSPQHDARHLHHCKNRCLMRHADSVGALRNLADDWRRDIILCGQCRGRR
jgi:predicted Zn-dependent protease